MHGDGDDDADQIKCWIKLKPDQNCDDLTMNDESDKSEGSKKVECYQHQEGGKSWEELCLQLC